MLKEWMPKRIFYQLLILLAGQILSYYGAKAIIANSPHINIALPIDGYIPFIPATILIYYGCFLFWIINYTLILKTEPEGTYRFLCAELMGKFVCFVTYILLPTIMIRPELAASDIFTTAMGMMYSLDAPDALFPSMHCYVSWMCVIGLRKKPQISQRRRIISVIAALLVFIATLTTKQHVIVDVIAGVILAELVYLVAGLLPCCKSAVH